MAFKFGQRRVTDPLSQQNFEQLEGLFPVAADLLDDAAVATAALADAAVTTDKLADAAVTGGKLADGAVSLAKLGMRLSWGQVAANGTVVNAGSGDWTCAITGTGTYTITWTPSFASAGYAFLANVESAGAFAAKGNGGHAAGAVAVVTFNTTTGVPTGVVWDFLAIGAR